MSMYNDNFLMILPLAANCFEHLLSLLVAVNLLSLLLPCKVEADFCHNLETHCIALEIYEDIFLSLNFALPLPNLYMLEEADIL